MMRWIRWIGALAFVGGCLADGDVHHMSSTIAVVDTYEKTFEFDQPRPCRVLLHRRVTDEDARLVEYDARIGASEVSAVYSIDATALRPLVVEVFEGGQSSLRIEATDHELAVRAGDEASIEVLGYDRTRVATQVEVSGSIADGPGLALLACVLPTRAELGPVPAFLLNRASGGRDPQNPDVSHTSSNPDPILAWTGTVTLLGALLLEGACLQEKDWSCPCLTQETNPLSGPVAGWCVRPPIRLDARGVMR